MARPAAEQDENARLVRSDGLARVIGLVGPDQFLPMAEETGLITDLGVAVMRSSLSQVARWRARTSTFENVTVSVNVSVRQLVDGGFLQHVRDALAESGLEAEAVWLEITETALMSDVKAADTALRGVEIGLSPEGELLVKGPNVMRGYWRDPERTAEVLKDGWYHTGDLGGLDAEGNVTIAGRAKDLLVLPSGMKVWPVRPPTAHGSKPPRVMKNHCVDHMRWFSNMYQKRRRRFSKGISVRRETSWRT